MILFIYDELTFNDYEVLKKNVVDKNQSSNFDGLKENFI